MHTRIEDLLGLTSPQLVSAYNAGQIILGRSEDDFVKKFRDHKTGVARLEKITADIEQMHGFSELQRTEDGQLIWSTEKPHAVAIAEKAAHSGSTTLDLSVQLFLLAPANPKRPGTRAYDTFIVYQKLCEDTEAEVVPTGDIFIEAMIAAGYSRKLALSTLHWDIDHGFIRLGLPEDAGAVELPDVTQSENDEAAGANVNEQ